MVLINKLASRMLACRGLATTAPKQKVHPVYAKMKETSKQFQINDGQGVSSFQYNKPAKSKEQIGIVPKNVSII